MHVSENVKLAVAEIDRLGGVVLDIDTTRRHPVVTFIDTIGRECAMHCAGTSCSVRGTWNQRARIRRFFRTGVMN